MTDPDGFTVLLQQWRGGREDALEALTPMVYEELRRLARRHMRAEQPGHTLQTTALVHEAYLGLVKAGPAAQDRSHFCALAARLMRRILIDHARANARDKRGGNAVAITLEDGLMVSPTPPAELIELDEALTRLGTFDERKSRVVELHFFGGLTYDEMAEVLEVSTATVHRELRLAKAWLYAQMHPS